MTISKILKNVGVTLGVGVLGAVYGLGYNYAGQTMVGKTDINGNYVAPKGFEYNNGTTWNIFQCATSGLALGAAIAHMSSRKKESTESDSGLEEVVTQ